MTAPPASSTWITPLDPDLDPLAAPDGIRLAVKDCIDVAGVVTTAGSPAIAASAEPAPADAPCLELARAGGARIVGKANLHELCFGSSGVNPHYGTPVNPIDPRRVPGGSSSGSAVAVASGEADVGFGTDTAGSIRNPAACCGIAGLVTTFGLVPVTGVRPLAPSLDTVGVLAGDVTMLATGATLLDPRLTDGDLAPSFTAGRLRLPGTDPTIDAAIDSALIEAGIEATEIELPGWGDALAAALTVLFGEALIVNDDLWRHHHEALGPDLVERFTFAQAISPAELGDARARREPWRAELAEVFGAVGVIVLPTMLGYPSRLGSQQTAPNLACPAVNLAGHPAVALPVPSGGLLPASIQLVAPDHHEPRLLATAALIEAAVAAP
ncbi:amidase [Aquihabitans daechungensis]|uniref:amidase n=1 Tax=Aquihabitans daechungensis TaxID=1052257 RepID=UPI003BA19B71